MCGRFAQTREPPRYVDRFGPDWLEPAATDGVARFNIAPTQDALAMRIDPRTGRGALGPLRWGLVPRWAPDPAFGGRTINARSESVATTPAFRDAWAARRRCAVPVDAFYEWKAGPSPRQPHAIAAPDRAPLALAGLWDGWKDPATGEWLRSFTLLTCPANAAMAALHDRMPVILAPEAVRPWLAGETGAEALVPFTGPLDLWPVSPRINRPANDDADLLAPALPVAAMLF
ncbi:MAG: SOS response-associated peptidase [Pseudomonadota bacterium]